MARDGLFPQSFFGAVHEKYRTPWKSTILTGIVVAFGAALLPLRILAELTNIGTLFAFVVVCAAVLIMRVIHPEAPRPFKAPFSPLTPILGIVTCLILMFSLPVEKLDPSRGVARHRLLIYFGYGRKHSVMARLAREKIAGA
jgi:APA family basic amino acid/polyamine antiporter